MNPGEPSPDKAKVAMKKLQALENATPDLQDSPPPSYLEVQSQKSVADQSPPSREEPAYPPLAYHSQSPSFILHVRYESWRTNDTQIVGPDNATTLYTLKLHIRKPQMVLTSATINAPIATVTFPSFSSRIDTAVHDASIVLTSRGLLKNGHTWSSPSLGNVNFTWKSKPLSLDLECLDDQDVLVALYFFPHLSWRKAGRFEMYGPEVIRGPVMEEVLVTGLAMVEYNLGTAGTSCLA